MVVFFAFVAIGCEGDIPTDETVTSTTPAPPVWLQGKWEGEMFQDDTLVGPFQIEFTVNDALIKDSSGDSSVFDTGTYPDPANTEIVQQTTGTRKYVILAQSEDFYLNFSCEAISAETFSLTQTLRQEGTKAITFATMTLVDEFTQ